MGLLTKGRHLIMYHSKLACLSLSFSSALVKDGAYPSAPNIRTFVGKEGAWCSIMGLDYIDRLLIPYDSKLEFLLLSVISTLA